MNTAFVIGHPIKHSKSPLIHGTWLNDLGIAGAYVPQDVAPDALPGFIERVREGEFVGGNVTIPHKEAVMALIDHVDPLAAKIGAVNTIVRHGRALEGFNTDYLGFLANLDAGAPGWDAQLQTAIVLGAGGASRAILVGLIDRGVPEIVLINRTSERAERLAHEFGPSVRAATFDDFPMVAPRAGLVVNTSAVGMDGTRFDDLALETLKTGAVVTDIVYTPLMTPLLTDARAQGFAYVDGLGMLLHQAVPGFAAWFGTTPRVDDRLRSIVLGEDRKI